MKTTFFIAACLLYLSTSACVTDPKRDTAAPDSIAITLRHLDRLGEQVTQDGVTYRYIHIYSEAPDYGWRGDDDEGIACVDDAARAAVVYLRHYELTKNAESLTKAKELLRFVMRLQAPSGYFYNFIWDNTLRINTVHENSRADELNWWSTRAVWALGTGARVLKTQDPAFTASMIEASRRLLPAIDAHLANYPRTELINGLQMPTWLVYRNAADATSELMLGMAQLADADPQNDWRGRAVKYGEGVARMRAGTMTQRPYGAHLSYVEGWHAWGNSQMMALSAVGLTSQAKAEADVFLPWLLVSGWKKEIPLSPSRPMIEFEQIAYGVRTQAIGAAYVFKATGDDTYAVLAGLLASWLTGNNVASTAMYQPLNGYGYDGINSPTNVNRNAGAESTIEALMTLVELREMPEAMRWIHARTVKTGTTMVNGRTLTYKLFETGVGSARRQAAILIDPELSTFTIQQGTTLSL